MIPVRIIERKRDGEEVSSAELDGFLRGYLDGDVAEYQMAAFLMAVVFRGLSRAELNASVRTMMRSGAVLDLSDLDRPRVDKHSTGGVGDKVSLALAPLAAELGLYVPMMSGRGLGHTGGTLDKLEAIPGFRTDLDLDAFRKVLAEVGCAMIGQTAEIAPLDRRLYDLRSVTGTVSCLPLIAASIMSKKLAEGLTALVLDVKVGEGAFLPSEEEALELARTMVVLGEDHDVPTTALLTAMDRPLGLAIGNALEAAEAFRCLAGDGPDDLRELVVELAAEMVRGAGMPDGSGDPRSRALAALDDGRALRRMERMVEAQGGDPRAVSDPGRLAGAPRVETVLAPRSGLVARLRPLELGRAVVALGGGRVRLGDAVDPSVGFLLAVRPGDHVTEGDALGEVHARDDEGLRLGRETLLGAVEIAADTAGHPVDLRPLVSHRVTRHGAEPWRLPEGQV